MTRLRFISLFAVSLCCCAVALGQILKRSDLHADANGMPGERVNRRTVEVGPGVVLNATIEVTAKGNGTLNVGNLQLRVVDEHDDGATYQDGMAHVEFADIDGDGWKDVVIVGVVNYTDEKTGAVRKREPFAFVYRYNPKQQAFRLSYKHASFTLENGPQALP